MVGCALCSSATIGLSSDDWQRLRYFGWAAGEGIVFCFRGNWELSPFHSPTAFQEFCECWAVGRATVAKEPLPDFIWPNPAADIGIPTHPGAKQTFGMSKEPK